MFCAPCSWYKIAAPNIYIYICKESGETWKREETRVRIALEKVQCVPSGNWARDRIPTFMRAAGKGQRFSFSSL